MDIRKFCNDMDTELTTWSDRLRHVSGEFDRVASIDKYKLTEQINGLHILLTEMQDRLCEIKCSCQIGELSNPGEAEAGFGIKDPEYAFKEGRGVSYDYDFGG